MEEEVFVFEGKTANEAIEKGLKELKTTRNLVEINIIEEESKKTFFSILEPKKVKVEIKKKKISNEEKENSEENIKLEEKEKIDIMEIKKEVEEFIKKFISVLDKKNIKYDIENQNDILTVNLTGKDASILIGYRGETLNSLQNIITFIANKKSNYKVKVELNINNYREERIQDLKTLARRIASSVVEKKKPVKLEPMNAFDRKIIHTELQNNELVTTRSVGEEPFRKVIISLK